jgi:UDP-N-acetylmuramoylalanine--D-glutamate ligase
MSTPRATLVVGARSSGLSAARLLRRLGDRVLLTDDNGFPEQVPDGVELVPSCEAEERLGDVEQVVLSPGIPAHHPLIRAALAGGVRVRSELALAADHVHGRVLAITGTNGKSTVTTLVADVLRKAGRRAFAGGNLGTPLCDAVGGDYDDLVVEVSSFQLEWPHGLRPVVATVLNISPDHLDRHGSMEAYIAAKMNLFANMDRDCAAVFLRDETWWQVYASGLRARVSTFGSTPIAAGEQGAVFDTGRRAVSLFVPERIDLALPAGWPRFPHEIENVAAAAEIARLAGAPVTAIEQAVAEFTPLPHRLALVGTRRGVRFFDDSKATNIGATLKSLEAFDEPVILLAGGVGKGVDFSLLAQAAPRLRLVIAYGESAAEVESALAGKAAVARVGGFAEAFAAAAERARPGDVVLLAPACASFDEFRGYADRGRRFVELLRALGA